MGLKGLLAGLLFLAPGAAFAQAPDQPEQVYQKLHRATLAGNAEEMMALATTAKRNEMKNMPGRDAMIKMTAGLMPKQYTVNSRVFNPDGKTARLIASGMGEFMGSHSTMYGTVNFIREEGQWRVDQWEWGNQKPAAFPVAKPAETVVTPAAAGAAATPAAQAANAPEEESKLAKQEARKKAREEAEAKRIAEAKAKAEADQKAYEARWKDCVIKPVMSDDDLRKCGVAIKTN